MTYVVAVAAPIGGGKTSLVTAIASALQDAATIHFDHYEKITEQPVDHLVQWLKKGADFCDFKVPGLAGDLEKLKQGKSIVDPVTKKDIKPRKYVIFEMPLGREHRDTASYIDLLLWVDIPLDVALARKLRQFTGSFLKRFDPLRQRDFILWLDAYLENYIKAVGHVLRIQEERVKPMADVIVDGTQDLERMTRYSTKMIQLKAVN